VAKGIEIGIASETRAFKQGIDAGIIAPLDDAQKALEELATTKGPEKLEQSLHDAQDATEKLGRETKDAAREIERRFRETYRGVKEAADTGIGGARQNVQEFKQEALQNFSEVTSSFDGSMNSIQDLAQGTLGGLASGIAGPIGLAAGAGAAAIGLIAGAVQGLGTKTEADQQKVAEWAQSYIEAGSKILTSAQGTARALEIIQDPEQFKNAQESAKDWGVTTATAIAALAGQQWAIDAVSGSLADMNTQLDAFGKSNVAPTDETYAKFSDLADQYDRGAGKLKNLTSAMDEGAKRADVYSQYLTELAQNTAGATSKVDKFGDAIYSLPDGTKVYIDAETGQATSDLDAIEKQIYKVGGTTSIDIDTTAAQRKLDALLDQPRTVKVGVKFKDQIGREFR
jgi:hypothetical protein